MGILGLAALAGLSAVVFGRGELIPRAIGTLIASLIVLALTLAASRRLGQPRTCATGLAAIVFVLVGYVLVLGAIWLSALFPWYSEELSITAASYVACVAPATVYVAVFRQHEGRLAGLVGLMCCGLVFGLILTALWVLPNRPNESILETVLLLAWLAVPLTLGLYGRRGDGQWWRWIGVALAGALILWGLGGLLLAGRAPLRSGWELQGLILAAGVGFLNALLRMPRAPRAAWLVQATAAALVATVLATFVACFVTDGFSDPFADEIWLRLASAGAVLTACGFLASVLMAALAGRRDLGLSTETSRFTRLSATCPRCALAQDLTVGESRCAGCGLVFQLAIAEPRCPSCEYVLLDFRGHTCPECGTRVGGAVAAATA